MWKHLPRASRMCLYPMATKGNPINALINVSHRRAKSCWSSKASTLWAQLTATVIMIPLSLWEPTPAATSLSSAAPTLASTVGLSFSFDWWNFVVSLFIFLPLYYDLLLLFLIMGGNIRVQSSADGNCVSFSQCTLTLTRQPALTRESSQPPPYLTIETGKSR